MDFLTQGLFRSSGVVLRRRISAEGDISLHLFLKGVGPVWVQAPGSARGRGRFGGATEPLTWGSFNLYKGPKHLYLKTIDVKDDMWTLRLDPEKLHSALEWNRMVSRYTCSGVAEDDVLILLYWTMRSLCEGANPLFLSWRLLWRWLYIRGEAPDQSKCEQCGVALKDAVYWSDSGFLCQNCSSNGGSSMIASKELRLLQAAAMLPRRNLISFSSQGAPSDGTEKAFWKTQIGRLKMILDRSC